MMKLNSLIIQNKKTFNAIVITIFILMIVLLFVTTNKFTDKPEPNFNDLKILENHIEDSCKYSNQELNEECFTVEFSKVIKDYGLEAGVTVLSNLQEKISTLRSCHFLGHHMGNYAYQLEPKKVGVLDKLNPNICNAGLLHGYLGGFIYTNPETVIDQKFVSKLCKEVQIRTGRCSYPHPLGHILLVNNGGDFTGAINACKKLETSRWISDCLSGVFMEDVQKTMLEEHGLAKRPTLDNAYILTLEARCMSYNENQIAKICWKEMAGPYTHHYGFNPKTIFEKCSQSKNDEYRDECYFSAASNMSITYTKPGQLEPLQDLPPLCSNYISVPDLYRKCLEYIINVNIHSSKILIGRIKEFCAHETKKYQNTTCDDILAEKLKYS